MLYCFGNRNLGNKVPGNERMVFYQLAQEITIVVIGVLVGILIINARQ